MVSDLAKLSQERTQLFQDVYDGKIPKRVPMVNLLTHELCIEYAGFDLMEAQWELAKVFEEVGDKACQDFPSDLLPLFGIRFPSVYRLLGSRNFVMGSGGFIQHPEVVGMDVEDYDAMIASPYDCIVERVLPKLYTELAKDPAQRAASMAKAYKAYNDEFATIGMTYGKLAQKYGYANFALFAGMCQAPFDLLTDQLRSFKGILSDIRKIPEKVEAAVEALTPLMIKMATTSPCGKYLAKFIPLHMGPYMRTKDFEKLYWPTLKKTVEGIHELGSPSCLYVEGQMMRYLDYLYELPENTILWFEYGDPKVIKEKLGKKHIITGLYPLVSLKTDTKQQCIDRAKELIDIMAPGGKYFFMVDKTALTLEDINPETLQAVAEYVINNANY